MQNRLSILILAGWLLAGCSAIQIDFESGPSIFQVDLNVAEEPTGIPPTLTPIPANPTVAATRTPTLLPTPPPELPTVDPASARIVDIAAGGAHACALFQNGAVWCWGKNEFGQLGNGSTINSLGPVQVRGLAGTPTALVAGWAHTCALSEQGGVECWGYNKYGELGNGSTMDSAHPVAVKGLNADVQSIAAGDDHTCAVLNDGSLRCWGFNESGQLGDRTTLNSIVPVAVPGMAHPITAVAAGGGHTCALSDQRGILCWGDNAFGQLGDGQPYPNRYYAAIVPGLENNVTAIAARGGHTCALLSTGGVECWGDNQNGELGDGTLETRRTPVPVAELRSGVIGLAAGGTHTCAIARGGGVMCWGRNYHGQLGNGSKLSNLVPVSVTNLERPVKDLALGPEFSCSLMEDGRITCWGQNTNGNWATVHKTTAACLLRGISSRWPERRPSCQRG
jgi:alpha-tubulin suppressor-like RCC1 family protein